MVITLGIFCNNSTSYFHSFLSGLPHDDMHSRDYVVMCVCLPARLFGYL